jgi:hypothetical protein
MAEARSWCVARGVCPDAFFDDIWRVPGGFNFILKSMAIDNRGTVAVKVELLLWPGGGSDGLRLFVQTIEPDTTWQHAGWDVLNAQDALTLRSDGGPIFYWTSGALLRETGTLPTLLPA